MSKGNRELSNKEEANKVMDTDSTPYFATNKKWFYYNPDWNSYYGCLLTEEGKKIPEVVKSYNDFYDINNPLLYDGDLDDETEDEGVSKVPWDYTKLTTLETPIRTLIGRYPNNADCC